MEQHQKGVTAGKWYKMVMEKLEVRAVQASCSRAAGNGDYFYTNIFVPSTLCGLFIQRMCRYSGKYQV